MYVVVLILKPTGDQYHDITGFCKLFFFLFISFDEFFSWEQFHGKISFHSHFLAYTFTDNNILAFFWRLYQSQMAHESFWMCLTDLSMLNISEFLQLVLYQRLKNECCLPVLWSEVPGSLASQGHLSISLISLSSLPSSELPVTSLFASLFGQAPEKNSRKHDSLAGLAVASLSLSSDMSVKSLTGIR